MSCNEPVPWFDVVSGALGGIIIFVCIMLFVWWRER